MQTGRAEACAGIAARAGARSVNTFFAGIGGVETDWPFATWKRRTCGHCQGLRGDEVAPRGQGHF